MTQSPSILGIGLCTIAGAIIPLLGEAAVAASSLEVFGRWVQAGGTVGMVGVLLWIRNEEKARREKDEVRRDNYDKEQWIRYDRLAAASQGAFDRLAAISEKFSLRAGGVEKELQQLTVEVRILHESLPEDAIRRVIQCAEVNVNKRDGIGV